MATKRKATRRSPVRVSMRGTSAKRSKTTPKRRRAAPARRRKLSTTSRRKNPSRRRTSVAARRKSSVARRRRNPSLNWNRIGLQVGGLAVGAYVYNMGKTQIAEMIGKITPAGGDPKVAGLIQIVAGGAIVALGDYLASMPNIARSPLGTVVPTATLAMAAMLVNDGVQLVTNMSGTRRRGMRGTIVRSPMIASQIMSGTSRLGPGMRGSLDTYGSPQPSLQRMQGSLQAYGSPQPSLQQMQGTYAPQCI